MIPIINPTLILSLQLLVILGLLLIADRWLHRHLQGLMLLLTGDKEISLWLYAIVLLPGVILHELSHALVAKILGVKIGRINLLPRRTGKRIQLGFVPVQETDIVRASIIGGAPLIFGSIVVVAIGYRVFGTPEIIRALTEADWLSVIRSFLEVLGTPDVWIWVYLVFAISNTMLPSRSDVRAWPFLGLVLAVVTMLIILAGRSTLLVDGVGQFLTLAVRWVVLMGATTLLVDLPLYLFIFLMQRLLEIVKGMRVEYD